MCHCEVVDAKPRCDEHCESKRKVSSLPEREECLLRSPIEGRHFCSSTIGCLKVIDLIFQRRPTQERSNYLPIDGATAYSKVDSAYLGLVVVFGNEGDPVWLVPLSSISFCLTLCEGSHPHLYLSPSDKILHFQGGSSYLSDLRYDVYESPNAKRVSKSDQVGSLLVKRLSGKVEL